MIHKEGYPTIIITLLFNALIIWLAKHFAPEIAIIHYLVYAVAAFLLITVLQFFRNPARHTVKNENHILSPADGKVVVIEKVFEPEYLKTECIQISVFMSPINVHVNRNPIAGDVKYVKYHPGLYLVAWHPKSSTENERSTVVIQHKNGKQILFRQIAGALARRIVFYLKGGEQVEQGGEMGFIKFGSRVDVYVPIDAKVTAQLNQVVRGGESVLAEF